MGVISFYIQGPHAMNILDMVLDLVEEEHLKDVVCTRLKIFC